MKTVLGFIFAVSILGLAGCASGGYGGVYAGVSGEYPDAYYGQGYYPGYGYPGYAYPGHGYPYVVGPYDRDHYWDRQRHWERRRWHGDEHFEHH